MKNLTIARALLPLLLTAPLATGQAATATAGQTAVPTDDLRAVDRVIAARSKYVLADASREANDSTLAQIPRRGPRPRCPRGPSNPPPAYPSMWVPGGTGHPVAGALIGFCLGAVASSAANADKGGRVAAALGGAAVGALLGAAVGHSTSVFHRRRYHGGSWPDPDEAAAQAPHRKRSPLPTGSARPAPPDLSANAAAPLKPSAEVP
jgi:hypothetical protein